MGEKWGKAAHRANSENANRKQSIILEAANTCQFHTSDSRYVQPKSHKISQSAPVSVKKWQKSSRFVWKSSRFVWKIYAPTGKRSPFISFAELSIERSRKSGSLLSQKHCDASFYRILSDFIFILSDFLIESSGKVREKLVQSPRSGSPSRNRPQETSTVR